ncbi:MAG: Vps62-related protein [Chitinispirillaceae bacterium]|nr:Vps62-related protein [Chitinispirillaceae bacterium]
MVRIFLLIGLVVPLSAQDSIHIAGMISDGTSGLSQAFVLLKNAELSVETGPAGTFEISRVSVGIRTGSPALDRHHGLCLFQNRDGIFLTLQAASGNTHVRVYDIQGRMLLSRAFPAKQAGTTVKLTGGNYSRLRRGLFMISVATGATRRAYRALSIDGRMSLAALPGATQGHTSLAKSPAGTAVADTLIVNRMGYYPRMIPLTALTADFSSANAIVMEKTKIPCIDVGGLLIGFANQFDLVWNDAGSGQDWDGSFWQPRLDSADGFKAIGSYGKNLYDDPTGNRYMIVVKEADSSRALAAPVDYTQIWNDQGTGSNIDGSFWQPVPPAGYVACGVVAQSGYNKPPLDRVVCVREDLTTAATIGSRFWYIVSIPEGVRQFCPIAPQQVPTFGSFPLSAGTFTTYVEGTTPGTVHCLNVKLPIVLNNKTPPQLPKLSGITEPPNTTEPHFGRVMMVPFSVINDTTVNNTWQVTNTPFYRVERYQYYSHADLMFYINNGSSDYVWSDAITTGITEEQSQKFWHTTGISVTANAGFEFKGFSAGVSVTVSQEFGYESSSSISTYNAKTVTKTVTVAPYSIGILWQKNDLIVMKRCNEAGDCQTVGSETVPLESYYYDEIPVP